MRGMTSPAIPAPSRSRWPALACAAAAAAAAARRLRRPLFAPSLLVLLLMPLASAALPPDLLIESQLAAHLERSRLLEPDLTLQLTFSSDTPDDAEAVEEFRFNAGSGDFIARLQLADGSLRLVQGRAVLGIETWVPNRRLEAGEIIGAADLQPVMMPPGMMTAGMLRQANDIIGKELRRPLLANRPVQDRALIQPRAVLKGAKIEIRFRSGAMQLAAAGKALSDGAIGEVIRVVNTSSNAIVTAEVTAQGVVEVK